MQPKLNQVKFYPNKTAQIKYRYTYILTQLLQFSADQIDVYITVYTINVLTA